MKWVGTSPGDNVEKRTLVVGIGEPGAVWGKGLRLGDKLGGIFLNDDEVRAIHYVVDVEPT